jgi:hypothetical protein
MTNLHRLLSWAALGWLAAASLACGDEVTVHRAAGSASAPPESAPERPAPPPTGPITKPSPACLEGEVRAGECPVCEPCSGAECIDGEWVEYENYPISGCYEGCDPLQQDCASDALGCYYHESSSSFGCLEAGFGYEHEPCEQPNDCVSGSTCVQFDAFSRQCRVMCDATDPDGGAAACGGECRPLSELGYAESSVGVCIFLGG